MIQRSHGFCWRRRNGLFSNHFCWLSQPEKSFLRAYTRHSGKIKSPKQKLEYLCVMAENKVAAPVQDPNDKVDGKKSKKRPGKGLTHFICLPLVTTTSIPQLQESLQRFRDVSTAHSKEEQDTSLSTEHTWTEDRLKVIPRSAHQALGKYHLTLGTMDLSDEVEMQRAKDLLSSLDLEGMLKSAERPDAVVEAKKQRRHERNAQIQMPVSSGIDQPAKDHDEDQIGRQSAPETFKRPISPPPKREARTEPVTSTRSEQELNGKPDPLTVTLSGLGTFPSSKSARVFWAKPYEQAQTTPSSTIESAQHNRSKPSSRLYTFSLLVRQRFREAGFITETRPLVLHATVANIRQTVQPKGGRTSKGRAWNRGAQRWKEGAVDATDLIEVFDRQNGDVEMARAILEARRATDAVGVEHERADESREGNDNTQSPEQSEETGHVLDGAASDHGQFVWAKDIVIDRVALCKMGAEKSKNEILEGEWYPHLAEKMIFEQ